MQPLNGQTIRLATHDAVVWSTTQIVSGTLDSSFARHGVLYVNGTGIPFQTDSANAFHVTITIPRGTTSLVAAADSNSTRVFSDSVRFTLGYIPRPDVFAYATVSGRTVELHATVLENPDSTSLAFTWSADPGNPLPLALENVHDTLARCTFPQNAPPGEYRFSVQTLTPDGDSVRARTYVTVGDSIVPFQIGVSHAQWIDKAILYEISPFFFVESGQYRDITEKIPDLLDLGVTTLWLQPVMETIEPYQGYHTTDYFKLRTDLGTEEDFRELIRTAHANGLKVMLDIVPNHTSIQHPYALDAIAYGQESHYYSYYTTSVGSKVTVGKMTFSVYYWATLPALNYDDPEVQRMILEAGRYWVERYDIDGYRVDAVWAMNQRKPAFTLAWCQALKRTKPELLLLAEDFASSSMVFDGRFDAAYDWGAIGRWAWSAGLTTPSNFRKALTNGGKGFHPRALILRFMENNDVDRSVAVYGPLHAKMIAVLTMAVNGLPMLYNGQEVGALDHPYTGVPVFNRGVPIKAHDHIGIYPFYKHLIGLHKKYASLSSRNFEEMGVRGASWVYAFHRWSGAEHIFGLANLGAALDTATVIVPLARLGLDSTKSYYITDLLTGKWRMVPPGELDSLATPIPGYTAQLWYVGDRPVAVDVDERATAEVPGDFGLEQNWPNPWNPSTTIGYTVGGIGDQGSGTRNVKLAVYNLLGQEVATLVNEQQAPGRYTVRFDGSGCASGVYFYRLQAGMFVQTKKMVLVR